MNKQDTVRIKIIGVGGGGSNAVNWMVEKKLTDVSYVSANTDNSAVERSLADEKIQIGRGVTKGYGAGADSVLLYFTCSGNVELSEVDRVASIIAEASASNANIILGLSFNYSLNDEMRVLLLATHKTTK